MPKLVYDDDCGFCSWCAWRVYKNTDWGVVGFSELNEEEKEILPSDYEERVHVIHSDYVNSGGSAAEDVLNELGLMPDDVVNHLSSLVVYRHSRDSLYEALANQRGTFGTFLRAESPPTRR